MVTSRLSIAACYIQDIDKSCVLISAMFPHIAGLNRKAFRKDAGLESDGCWRGLFLFDLTLSGAALRKGCHIKELQTSALISV